MNFLYSEMYEYWIYQYPFAAIRFPQSRFKIRILHFLSIFSKEQKPFRTFSRISNHSYSHSKICQTYITTYKGISCGWMLLVGRVVLTWSIAHAHTGWCKRVPSLHTWPYPGISWTLMRLNDFSKVILFYFLIARTILNVYFLIVSVD